MKIKISIIELKKYIYLICISLFFMSCGSKQDIVYFQNVDSVGSSSAITQFNRTIKPDDMLTIVVSALDQDAVRPFNLANITFSGDGQLVGRPSQQSYLVDADGNIDFPVLGSLKLEGLSRIQATSLIKGMLTEYIKNPIVNIRTVNFKVTVLGEVSRPGSYTIPNERITIIEALGLAGDMTIQAERKNVLVIREKDGKKTYNRVNMTSEDVFNSPVYYLSQNDVIYVEPNNSRVKSSTVGPNTGATFQLITTLITAAAFAISLSR